MAKMTLDEFKNKYNERITDNDDLVIELFEDVSDSFTFDDSEYLTKIEELENTISAKDNEILDLKTKYKERFLTGSEDEPIKEQSEEELEEKQVIDIKEI